MNGSRQRPDMGAFARYIGIDYSGAETPMASLKGLRVYMADGNNSPIEVLPPASPRKYWTRRGIAEWLVARLGEDKATLVGIDHGFSFPLRYFEVHHLPPDWHEFLDDFQRHWPTDEDIYVDFVRDGIRGNGAARMGNSRWRRLTEERSGGAKSVFHFDVQGSVAKSTHAGIPWLRYIRDQLGKRVHFWPFDGWDIPAAHSAIAEAYPALWSRNFAIEDRTPDQHDAFSIASWLSRADRNDRLAACLNPDLTPPERAVAQVEGWILGVPGLIRANDKTMGRIPNPTAPRTSVHQGSKHVMPESEKIHNQETLMATIRKYLKPGQKVVLLLTEEECGLITSLTYIPEELMQAIYSSKCRDEIVSARFTLSELEELGGCIAAEANHTKSRKLRKSLDAVFEKIEQLNLKYCDEDSSIQETSIPQLKKKPNLVLVKK